MVQLADILQCPLHAMPLTRTTEGLTCPGGETFPIIDGIPVMLPEQAERQKLAQTDWSNPTLGATPLDFYNRSSDEERYYRQELPSERADLDRWLDERRAEGPTLEIGSGRGVLQGLGGDYIAIDYSFTAIHKHVSPEHVRVCGTVEKLPFLSEAFSMIFTVAVLEHVPAPDRAFDEIHRVLKPGGIAYLAPAWHCVKYNCEGIPVRPYRELTLRQKWVKATLPLRTQRHMKALVTLPGRLARRALWMMQGRPPVSFRFKTLPADYERFWTSDSDACSRLDSHEGCLFFASRGYQVLSPGPSSRQQLYCGHQPVIVRKPA